MKIFIQKEITPDVKYKLDFFCNNDFPAHNAKGYVAFSSEEDICIVYADYNNGHGGGGGHVHHQNLQNYGQFAFRIKNDLLQYFQQNEGWISFHESAQVEFQMSEADKILLGGQ